MTDEHPDPGTPRPEPGAPSFPPPPFPPQPVREPDPERLPDEDPLPNPDEADQPPQHVRPGSLSGALRRIAGGCMLQGARPPVAEVWCGTLSDARRQERRRNMTLPDDDEDPDEIPRPRAPSLLGGRYFADLLKNIGSEPVPDRLLDLARQLDAALARQRDEKKDEDTGGAGTD
jgi:hypothetical protein